MIGLIKSLQGTTIVQIASAAYHSLALDSEGQVWAWGHNGHGRLGLQDQKDRWVNVCSEADRQESTYSCAIGERSIRRQLMISQGEGPIKMSPKLYTVVQRVSLQPVLISRSHAEIQARS